MRRWIAIVALIAGCSSSPESEPQTEMPDVVDLPPTNGTLSVPFTVSVTGSAHGLIAINGNAGTYVEDGAPLAAVVYLEIPWAPWTLYQGFAVGPNEWTVFWIYCDGTQLVGVWSEGIDGEPMTYYPGSGTCAASATATDVEVDLPAVSFPAPMPLVGYSVSGADLLIQGLGEDRVWDFPLVAFEDVVIDTAPAWWELHSLLWDESAGRAVFTIFYLLDGEPGRVSAAYALSLPDLTDPVGNPSFDAEWTAP